MCLEISNNLLLVHFFLRTRDLLVSKKTTQRRFIFTLHPLSTVIFATATVLAFVQLRNSSFNFHREATPTQKLARKGATTSHDFFAERLQSAFAVSPNTGTLGEAGIAQLVGPRPTEKPGVLLTRVRVPGAARDFSPRVSFQCRLSYGVQTAPVCNRMHRHPCAC